MERARLFENANIIVEEEWGLSNKSEEESLPYSMFRISWREQGGIFRMEINPFLDHIIFKIFFFIFVTTMVFLVSVFAALLVMKLFEYLTDIIQEIVKQKSRYN